MAELNNNISEYESALTDARHKDAMNVLQLCVKRILDIVGAILGLLVCSPLILFVVIALLLEHDGPVIFSQERIGYKGRPFTIYKFRSMKTNAEDNGIPRLDSERAAHLTKVGTFLRNHHLDELPQLWNVLKGDMSFVGPRPERQYFIDQISQHTDEYRFIYLMRPGLSSKATLYNGYTDTMEKMLTRLKMDIEYLETRSLSVDFGIIFDTFWSIVSGKKF